jgi:hypothetical protein
MIRVDEKFLDLATRVYNYTDGGDGFDFFILGSSFTAAWLTGTEIRAGKKGIAPSDLAEYNRVQMVLEKLGWLDLLDA